jgi:riboflavin synthase
MFTGIIEEVGEVVEVTEHGTNRDFWIRSNISDQLRIDQSVSHNGVCLTVVELRNGSHRVTAVSETLDRTQLDELRKGSKVNLERSLRLGDRLDGHMVQGHVDATVQCTGIKDLNGSWWFTFRMPAHAHLLVAKGSICINGVSLTIADIDETTFSVAIIPYTFDHTTFRQLRVGEKVNLEFDVLGKYVERMLALRGVTV